MIEGKEVLDDDGDQFRYNPALRVFELFYKKSHWIFWCKGPNLDCFEHESNFRVVPKAKEVSGTKKETSMFGAHPGPRGKENVIRTMPFLGTDANGTPIEA
jgi:hypothetical protein